MSAPLHDRAEVSERTGIDDIGLGSLTEKPPIDPPPLNVATFGERISGSANQGRARDATREKVHCGEDHREAPRG